MVAAGERNSPDCKGAPTKWQRKTLGGTVFCRVFAAGVSDVHSMMLWGITKPYG